MSGQKLGREESYAVVLGALDDDGDLDLFAGLLGQDTRVWLNAGNGELKDR